MDQAWKSYKGVQTLVGNISIASKVKQEELEDACDEAWSALSLRQEWMDFSAAQQPLDTKKLVAFMRSVKSR